MRALTAPRIAATVLTAAAVALSACGTDTAAVAELRDDLEVQAQAQASLRDRIQELENLLNAGDETGQQAVETLRALEEQVASLTDELSQARLDLDEAKTAAEDRTAQVDASITSLDARVLALETRIKEIEGLIAKLRTDLLRLTDDHELLRAEFEKHQRDHN